MVIDNFDEVIYDNPFNQQLEIYSIHSGDYIAEPFELGMTDFL